MYFSPWKMFIDFIIIANSANPDGHMLWHFIEDNNLQEFTRQKLMLTIKQVIITKKCQSQKLRKPRWRYTRTRLNKYDTHYRKMHETKPLFKSRSCANPEGFVREDYFGNCSLINSIIWMNACDYTWSFRRDGNDIYRSQLSLELKGRIKLK